MRRCPRNRYGRFKKRWAKRSQSRKKRELDAKKARRRKWSRLAPPRGGHADASRGGNVSPSLSSSSLLSLSDSDSSSKRRSCSPRLRGNTTILFDLWDCLGLERWSGDQMFGCDPTIQFYEESPARQFWRLFPRWRAKPFPMLVRPFKNNLLVREAIQWCREVWEQRPLDAEQSFQSLRALKYGDFLEGGVLVDREWRAPGRPLVLRLVGADGLFAPHVEDAALLGHPDHVPHALFDLALADEDEWSAQTAHALREAQVEAALAGAGDEYGLFAKDPGFPRDFLAVCEGGFHYMTITWVRKSSRLLRLAEHDAYRRLVQWKRAQRRARVCKCLEHNLRLSVAHPHFVAQVITDFCV